MANPILISESTLTDRYQTTVPDLVRKALHLNKRGKIRYTIQANGDVIMSRANQQKTDPVLEQFLSFLAQDISKNPQHVQAVNNELVLRIQSLVADVKVDLNSHLSEEDE